MSDIISPQTMLDLALTTKQYEDRLACPFIADVGAFAAAGQVDVDESSVETLITTYPDGDEVDGLAVSIRGSESSFTNIDFPPDGPALVVRPNYYDKDGNLDVKEGEFRRLVQRPLTELEGQALIADMLGTIDQAPPDRLK